jgi:rod shape-determining protein MreC
MYSLVKTPLQENTVALFTGSGQNVVLRTFNRIYSWINDFFHFNYLRQQVQSLAEENNILLSQLVELKSLQEENKSLKEAFKVKQTTNWHLLPAQIIMVDPTGLTGSFWINQGQNNGLKPGMNVILANQILVGTLKECFSNYCRGESIFSPQTKIGVKDVASNFLAILIRDNQGRFILKLVPRDTNIQPNDLLVTSIENTNFLPNLLVAKVKSLIPSESSLEEYLTEPLFIPQELSSVFVITDSIF